MYLSGTKKCGRFWSRALVFFVALTLTLGLSGAAFAEDGERADGVESASSIIPLATTADGLVYEIDEARAYVTGYTGTARSLTIPAKLEGQNVVRVNLRETNLISLNVSACTELQYLNCSGSAQSKGNLTALDVSNNSRLTELHCEWNDLINLDINNNSELWTLYCNFNKLSTLNVSNNLELTWLNCQHNELNALDVSRNSKLKYFTCDNNKLTSLTDIPSRFNSLTAGF